MEKPKKNTVRMLALCALAFCLCTRTVLALENTFDESEENIEENDSEEEMRSLSSWVAALEEKLGKEIPLHITRFFPMSRYADRRPTPVKDIYHLADVAREKLKYVYEGNI